MIFIYLKAKVIILYNKEAIQFNTQVISNEVMVVVVLHSTIQILAIELNVTFTGGKFGLA